EGDVEDYPGEVYPAVRVGRDVEGVAAEGVRAAGVRVVSVADPSGSPVDDLPGGVRLRVHRERQRRDHGQHAGPRARGVVAPLGCEEAILQTVRGRGGVLERAVAVEFDAAAEDVSLIVAARVAFGRE